MCVCVAGQTGKKTPPIPGNQYMGQAHQDTKFKKIVTVSPSWTVLNQNIVFSHWELIA